MLCPTLRARLGAALACFVVLGLPSAARPAAWELGAKLGAHFGKMTGDGASGFSIQVDEAAAIGGNEDLTSGDLDNISNAFSGGIYVGREVSDWFGVRLEGLFTRKGGAAGVNGILATSDTTFVEYDGELALRLDYFEFPLLAVFSWPTNTGIVFEAVAGPSLGFNTKAKSKLDLTVTAATDQPEGVVVDPEPSYREDLGDVIKSTDFAGVLGASMVYPTDTFSFLLDLRWTFSLSSIDESPESRDLKNRGISFTVGWSFPIASGE